MTEYADTVAAHPSGEDLDRAWPVLDFIILSVQRGRPAELSCWRPRDDRSGFDREDITWPIGY
jgi:proteasome lid subunit RPN8/RPN11